MVPFGNHRCTYLPGNIPSLPLVLGDYSSWSSGKNPTDTRHDPNRSRPVVVIDGAIWQLQRRTLGISRVWIDLLRELVPSLLRFVFVMDSCVNAVHCLSCVG